MTAGAAAQMATQIGGSAGDAFGAIIGELLAAGDYETAEKLMQEASRSYDGMQAPSSYERVDGSAMAGVNADGHARGARRMALDRLMKIGLEGGMDAESRAAIEGAKQEAAGYEQQQRGAIMQNANARGQGSQNLAQAQALMAQQGGADRVGMAGIQAAGDARKRALAALTGAGDMAGSLERDAFGQDAEKASAHDTIAMFNARNANNFHQNQFDNTLAIKDRQAQGKLTEAEIYENRANRKKGTSRGVGRAIGGGGAYAAGSSSGDGDLY